MGKHKSTQLVPEDDAQFARFWASYPSHVAKKEARKAWGELAPSAELVDRMVAALTWQRVYWARTGYGTPYPASWLRAERWTDERPDPRSAANAWHCPHIEHCGNPGMCENKRIIGSDKYPVKAVAS